MRCKVCDRKYNFHFLAHFPDEDYCPRCEFTILETIREMEEMEEEMKNEATHPLP